MDTPKLEYQIQHTSLLEMIEEILTKKFKVVCGSDNEGNEYESLSELWYKMKIVQKMNVPNRRTKSDQTVDPVDSTYYRALWYQKALDYWDRETNAPATIDGMLGGYSALSDGDLKYSMTFVEEILLRTRPVLRQYLVSASQTMDSTSMQTLTTRSCECGSGIGRVTKGLLLPLGFTECHLVEVSERLIQEAPKYIGHPDSARCNFICCGLENYEPEAGIYDIIWIQWVIGYLTDYDCVQFLKRMAKSLRKEPKGMIVIKDNTCTGQAFVVDTVDSSLTRSLDYLLALVELSGLRVIDMKDAQGDFPSDIYPVPILALECP